MCYSWAILIVGLLAVLWIGYMSSRGTIDYETGRMVATTVAVITGLLWYFDAPCRVLNMMEGKTSLEPMQTEMTSAVPSASNRYAMPMREAEMTESEREEQSRLRAERVGESI